MKTKDVLMMTRDALSELNQWRLRRKRIAKMGQARSEVHDNPRTDSSQTGQRPPTSKPGQPDSPKPKDFLLMIRDTLGEWNRHKAPQLAAALSYYAIFSIAPLLVISIAVAGLAFGSAAAQNRVVDQISGAVGPQAATVIQDMLKNASKPSTGIPATILGIVSLIAGAAGSFGQLKASLNTIWEVPPPQVSGIQGILITIKTNLISLLLVLIIGFLLLATLILSAVLSALSNFAGNYFTIPPFVWQTVNFVVSFGIMTVLFAAIYKVLPDVAIDWGDVWFGAVITAFLFVIGQLLIGLYLGHSSVASTYGAAGSLVIILLWIYYSAQILFFGAEFSRIYAMRYGSRSAVKTTDPTRHTPQTQAATG